MGRKHRKLRVSRLKLKPMECIAMVGIVISIIVLMGTFTAYTENAKAKQLDVVLEVMEHTASNQREQFDNFVDDKKDLLRALARYPDIYEMNKAEQEKFIEGHFRSLGFYNIFVMDREGIGYYIDEGGRTNQKNEEFSELLTENHQLKTDLIYAEDGIPMVTIGVSIHNTRARKMGYLCGIMRLSKIQNIISKNEIILDGKSFILDKNGIFITSDNEDDVINKVCIFDTSNSDLVVLQDAIAEESDKRGMIILDGIQYEAYAAYMEDYNWLVVQIIPVEQITGLYASLSNMQKVLAVCIVLLVLCIVRIILRWNKNNNKIYMDTLTKCNSRAACLEMMEDLEDYNKESVTIVYMDLNCFKYVNDTYGHDKGDELLCIFTKELEQTIGKLGFVGRMGGDEFIAIFLDISAKQLMKLWKQFEIRLAERSKKLEFEYEISASYGYATREKGSDVSLDVIMHQADEQMYAYKARIKAKQAVK